MNRPFWTAPALPPSRRAIAPLRRGGGWRFCPELAENAKAAEGSVRIRDVEADRIVSVAFTGHGLGMAFVWSNRVHVFSGNWGTKQKWEIDEVEMSSSDDLLHWTKPVVVLRAEPQEKFFNVSVCRGRETFVLLQWAEFNGSPRQLFEHFFKREPAEPSGRKD